MQFIFSYIKNICSFMIIITLILNLFPNKSYLKYIKFVAGLLLLIIVLRPILDIKKIKININDIFEQYSETDRKSMLQDYSKIESDILERLDNYEDKGFTGKK